MLQYYIGPSLEQPGIFFSWQHSRCLSFLWSPQSSQNRYTNQLLCPRSAAHDRDRTSEKLLRVMRNEPEKFMHVENSPLRPPFPVPPPDTWTNFLNGPFFSNSSKNCRATPWGSCFEQPQNKSDLQCDCKDWIPEILLESHLVSSIFTFCSSAAILCMLIGPPCLYKKKNGNFLSRKSDKILLFIDFLVLWAVCHQHSRMFPGFSLVALSSAQIF